MRKFLLLFIFALGCAHEETLPETSVETPVAPPVAAPAEAVPKQAALKRNDPAQFSKPTVILISIDGCRADYIDRYGPPNLKKLRSQGVSSKGLISIYPSLTFPNHYAIVTGMTAEHHGLVGNHFYDPVGHREYHMNQAGPVGDGTFYGGTPLWTMVSNAGMISTSFFWIGSEAEIAGRRPDEWVHYDEAIPNSARIDRALEWLARPAETRPHFITLYFSDVDTAGHRFGPESNEVKKALLSVDRELGRLFKAIEKRPFPIDVIVVSDHGMQKVDPAKKSRALDGMVNRDDFKIFGGGPQLYLYANSPDKIEPAYRALKAAERDFRVYLKKDIPARYHFRDHPAVPDILIDAEIPYVVGFKDALEKGKPGGMHGFDPEQKNMWGTLIVRGPQFRSGVKLPNVRNVDIAPLVAQLLDLKPPQPFDGTADSFKTAWKPKRNRGP